MPADGETQAEPGIFKCPEDGCNFVLDSVNFLSYTYAGWYRRCTAQLSSPLVRMRNFLAACMSVEKSVPRLPLSITAIESLKRPSM